MEVRLVPRPIITYDWPESTGHSPHIPPHIAQPKQDAHAVLHSLHTAYIHSAGYSTKSHKNTMVAGHKETKLELTWKLPSRWLAFIGLCRLLGERSYPRHYSFTNAACYKLTFQARRTHWCNGGMKVMGTTSHSGIGFTQEGSHVCHHHLSQKPMVREVIGPRRNHDCCFDKRTCCQSAF